MAANGLFGIMLAEEDGGQGGVLMDAVIAAEEIARVCPRSADVLQAGNFGAFRTFAEYATDAQKERWFAPLLAGEAICAVGMTEPEAGSALTDLRSACTPDGNGYRLNGGKVFTSNSDDASVFLIYCRFGPGTHGIGSGLSNVLGRRLIRLAQAEVIHPHSCGLQLPGLGAGSQRSRRCDGDGESRAAQHAVRRSCGQALSCGCKFSNQGVIILDLQHKSLVLCHLSISMSQVTA